MNTFLILRNVIKLEKLLQMAASKCHRAKFYNVLGQNSRYTQAEYNKLSTKTPLSTTRPLSNSYLQNIRNIITCPNLPSTPLTASNYH